jgi:hypothetical protein
LEFFGLLVEGEMALLEGCVPLLEGSFLFLESGEELAVGVVKSIVGGGGFVQGGGSRGVGGLEGVVLVAEGGVLVAEGLEDEVFQSENSVVFFLAGEKLAVGVVESIVGGGGSVQGGGSGGVGGLEGVVLVAEGLEDEVLQSNNSIVFFLEGDELAGEGFFEGEEFVVEGFFEVRFFRVGPGKFVLDVLEFALELGQELRVVGFEELEVLLLARDEGFGLGLERRDLFLRGGQLGLGTFTECGVLGVELLKPLLLLPETAVLGL